MKSQFVMEKMGSLTASSAFTLNFLTSLFIALLHCSALRITMPVFTDVTFVFFVRFLKGLKNILSVLTLLSASKTQWAMQSSVCSEDNYPIIVPLEHIKMAMHFFKRTRLLTLLLIIWSSSLLFFFPLLSKVWISWETGQLGHH